jgi:hypothetical protein
MHHAVYIRAMLIDIQMAIHIGGRLVFAFDYFAVQVHHHHMLCSHFLVRDAAGLDHDETGFRVTRTDITSCPHDKVILRQFAMKRN